MKYTVTLELVNGQKKFHLTNEMSDNIHEVYDGLSDQLKEEVIILIKDTRSGEVSDGIVTKHIASFSVEPVVEPDFTRHRKAQESVEGISVTRF